MSIELHQQRMNNVLQWVENHLDTDLSVECLADIACYSRFHFQRLFKLHTGQTIGAYCTRLRLNRAAQQMLSGTLALTDVAAAAGFENQSSFNRAFRQQFAVTPTAFLRQQRQVQSYTLPNYGELTMPEVTIINRPEEAVLYCPKQGPYSQSAGEAWGQLMSFAYSNGLMNSTITSYGRTLDNPNYVDEEDIRYHACLTINTDKELPAGIYRGTIAAGRYAKILHKGPYEKLDQTYGYLLSVWLPASNEVVRDVPCIDKYLNRDPRRTKPENLRTEIYLPLEG